MFLVDVVKDWFEILKVKNVYSAFYNRYILKPNAGDIRVGLIGIGGWGAHNAISIMKSGRFNVVGVYDVNKTELERFSNKYRVRCHENLKSILCDKSIKAVCITVPNHLHEKFVMAAAEAGKAIFIEKPLASSPEECDALYSYCLNKQVVLHVGFQMRHDPVFKAIKHVLLSEQLGVPIFAQGISTMPRQNRKDWRSNPETCPGGSMEQLGIHLIDLLVYFFGPAVEHDGWATNIPKKDDGPDWGAVALKFSGNLDAMVFSSFSTSFQFELRVFCTDGVLFTDGKKIKITKKNEVKIKKPKGVAGGVEQFNAFADAIEQSLIDNETALQSYSTMSSIQSMVKHS